VEQERFDFPASDRRVAGRLHESHYAVVAAEPLLLQPERLADEAADPVPGGRARRETLRHDERETRLSERVGQPVEAEPGAARQSSALEHCRDRGGAEPLRSPQPQARRSALGRQIPRRARPFARRARITARPPRLRIRTRKPWVRFRRTTEG